MTLAKPFLSAVLYVALALGANPASAANLDPAHLKSLRHGEMRKLVILSVPQGLPNVTFLDMQGQDRDPVEFKGKFTVLNFWATWCAPCRREMPSLDALQRDLASDDFQVVVMATGRNPKPAIRKFFNEAKITSLHTMLDPTQTLSGLLGVYGLPMTLILNKNGKEIARMQGDADWHSPDALQFLRDLTGAKKS